MRGDLPLAAFRLLNALPVRTHERPVAAAPSTARGNRYGRRPVIVRGVEYETIRDARSKLGIGYEQFYAMIAKGEARYL